jgi:high-affinity Fe2+/Pb2+ permease
MNPTEENRCIPTYLIYQKMKNKSTTRWVLQATSGLILTGSGLSLAIDAGISKLQGGEWFWYGTGALVVFQAGLCLVIDSTRFR